MRRADRLFEIIQIFRRERKPITASSIAAELEVSKRSIYRDIADLIAQRVPIRGEAGFGYVLEDGFDMPPLMLSADEIDAAVLGAMRVSSRGEPELAKAAQNLIAKIEAITPEKFRPHILEPSLSVKPVNNDEQDAVSSSSLREAIRRGQKLAIDYCDDKDRRTRRVIWPVLLGYRDEGRILAAWCELRNDFRYFRTDRMSLLQELGERYPDRPSHLKRKWQDAMDKERAKYFPGN